jgi:hypothetical protein
MQRGTPEAWRCCLNGLQMDPTEAFSTKTQTKKSPAWAGLLSEALATDY